MVVFGEIFGGVGYYFHHTCQQEKKLNWKYCLTDDKIAKKTPKDVLADVNRHGHLKQGNPAAKHTFFNKKGGISMHKRRRMVER